MAVLLAAAPASARDWKVLVCPLTMSARTATSLPVSVALPPTVAVLCTSATFTATAAATPVSALVLVDVERPCAAASASLCAATMALPEPMIDTPPATLAVLCTFM